MVALFGEIVVLEVVMKNFRLIVLLLIFLPKFVMAANCRATATQTTKNISGNITVPRNFVPGDPIGSVYGPFNGTSSIVTCDHVPGLYLAFATPQTLSYSSDIYETNIPGIGVKVWSAFSGNTVIGNSPIFWYKSNSSTAGSWIAGIYLQFFVTNNNVGQGIVSLPAPLIKSLTDTSTIYNYLSFNSTISISPEKGCSVTNSSQTVILNDVKTTALKHNTGRYPNGKNFNIELNCTPQTKVLVTFEGTTMKDFDNVLTNLSTGENSAGQSVGVQMMYGNTPVPLGRTLLAIEDAKSSESLPFTAHYYYNGGGGIKPGDVTAVTTFTFTYQ